MIVLWIIALAGQQADPQEQAVGGVTEAGQSAVNDRRADDAYTLGLRKMEAGDNAGAIEAFSNALRFRPDFREAEHAEAQALVGLARQQDAQGNYGEGRRLRQQAHTLDAAAREAPEGNYYAQQPRMLVEPRQLKPSRKDKWLGVNLNAGMETFVGVGVSLFILQHVELIVSLDTIKPAIDIAGRGIFLKSNWSPYLGIGGHIGLRRNLVEPDFWSSDFLHVDLGMQYMHRSGFYMDLGLTWFPPTFSNGRSIFGESSQSFYAIPLPHLAVGWAFDFGG